MRTIINLAISQSYKIPLLRVHYPIISYTPSREHTKAIAVMCKDCGYQQHEIMTLLLRLASTIGPVSSNAQNATTPIYDLAVGFPPVSKTRNQRNPTYPEPIIS